MKIKLAISVILAILVFLFITQNTETVRVKFLFWSVEMSLVLMVFILFVAGGIFGWLANSYLRYASQRRRAPGYGVDASRDALQGGTKTARTESREETPPDKKEIHET